MVGWLLAVLSTTIAVTPARAEEYVAFSLGVAQKRIEAAGGADWRKEEPEVFSLGGITKVRGLVYDRKTQDMILVGERDPKRPILTLDDLAVALRARFIYSQFPLVSIDPTPDTKKTNMQHVRYEGGIENTQFGLDMFDADLRLKKIGQGELESGAPGLKSTWEMNIARIQRGEDHRQSEVQARFWFYPVNPLVMVEEDVVAIEGLKVGVFTEVLSASFDGKSVEDVKNFVDPVNEEFKKQMSDRYPEVAAAHPSIARLAGLDELVALAWAIEEMDPKPDLTYWLEKYQVKFAATSKQQEVLKRRQEFGENGFFETAGGVRLVAIALQAGDVTALREAVLTTRSETQRLMWTFNEWGVPPSQSGEIAPLFAHALFLDEQRRYDDAITVYDRILKLNPICAGVYTCRGVDYSEKGWYDRAIQDYNNALDLNPNDAYAYCNRGIAYAQGKQRYDRAIQDFDEAVKLNPRYAEAYSNRGVAYSRKGDRGRAIADYDRALAIDANRAEVYSNRGLTYSEKGDYAHALADYERALTLNPNLWDAYYNRGIAYGKQGMHSQAIADFDKAIMINPKYGLSYYNRGLSLAVQGNYQRALADFEQSLSLDATNAKSWFGKAVALEMLGRKAEAAKAYRTFAEVAPKSSGISQEDIQYAKDRADKLSEEGQGSADHKSRISECLKAIEANPRDAIAHVNLGNAYAKEGNFEMAMTYYNKALALSPDLAEAYLNRGNCLADTAQYDRAITDYNKSIQLKPNLGRAYFSRGLAYAQGKRDYSQAIQDFDRALSLGFNGPEVYLNRGTACADKGEYRRALADLTKAIELDPNDGMAYTNRGTVYSAVDETDKALADYAKAIRLDPKLTGAYLNRGKEYLKMDRNDLARADFVTVIQLEPKNVEALYLRGSTYTYDGDYRKALADYTKALTIDPEHAPSCFGKAVALEKTGRKAEAAQAYNRFVEVAKRDDPNLSDLVRYAKERARRLSGINGTSSHRRR
jgi:tetratricopeptide (TPR) repeat protein